MIRLYDCDSECLCGAVSGPGAPLYPTTDGKLCCCPEHQLAWHQQLRLSSETEKILLLCSFCVGLQESIAAIHRGS